MDMPHVSLGTLQGAAASAVSCLMKLSLHGWWPLWTEFKKALHYHDEGYESNSDCGLPPHIIRLVCIYSIFSAEASFNLADYTPTQGQLSPFTLRCSRGLPFQEGICWYLTFDETSLLALAADSKGEEVDLPMAELDDPVSDKKLIVDSREYLCIHEIGRLATPQPPQPVPVTPTPQPNQVLPDTPPQ